MDIYKKFSLFVVIFSFAAFSFLCALLYVYDAGMLFHKPYFRDMSFKERLSERYIIEHFDFDSVILGTSMLQNTEPKEAQDLLGGKWVNLSIGGAKADERAIMLDFLLKHKQIKRVIYSLDMYLLNPSQNSGLNAKMYGDFLERFEFYLNFHFISCALTYSSSSKCIGNKDAHISNIGSWKNQQKFMAFFGGFEKWLSKDYFAKEELLSIKNASNEFNIPQNQFDLKKQENHINKNLFYFIENYPSVEFELIIPTYSKAFYKAGEKSYYKKEEPAKHFAKWMQILEFIITETSKYPNAKVYGFDNLTYAKDLANYKDLAHYNVDINSLQLQAIKEQKHILTPHNMKDYFDTLEKEIQSYDLHPLQEQIKEFESKNGKLKP